MEQALPDKVFGTDPQQPIVADRGDDLPVILGPNSQELDPPSEAPVTSRIAAGVESTVTKASP